MSTNIRVTRICTHCGKAFEARTTVTKTCSDACAKRAYKARQRSAKVETSDQQTKHIIEQPMTNLRAEEYLTVDESARLVRISRRTLYRLIERGELAVTKLSSRTVVRRADIDKLFEASTPAPTQKPAAPIALADCYSLSEVRQQHGISDKALHDLIGRNGIAKQRNGKQTYVPKIQIDKLLNSPSTPL